MLNKIYNVVQQSSSKGGVSAEELAEELKLHRTTVYSYLNTLEHMGKVYSNRGKWLPTEKTEHDRKFPLPDYLAERFLEEEKLIEKYYLKGELIKAFNQALFLYFKLPQVYREKLTPIFSSVIEDVKRIEARLFLEAGIIQAFKSKEKKVEYWKVKVDESKLKEEQTKYLRTAIPILLKKLLNVLNEMLGLDITSNIAIEAQEDEMLIKLAETSQEAFQRLMKKAEEIEKSKECHDKNPEKQTVHLNNTPLIVNIPTSKLERLYNKLRWPLLIILSFAPFSLLLFGDIVFAYGLIVYLIIVFAGLIIHSVTEQIRFGSRKSLNHMHKII